MGPRAGPAACFGASRGCRDGEPRGGGGARGRGRNSDAVRVLVRQLAAPQGGSRGPDAPAGGLPAKGDREVGRPRDPDRNYRSPRPSGRPTARAHRTGRGGYCLRNAITAANRRRLLRPRRHSGCRAPSERLSAVGMRLCGVHLLAPDVARFRRRGPAGRGPRVSWQGAQVWSRAAHGDAAAGSLAGLVP